jgi:hypothetical protein
MGGAAAGERESVYHLGLMAAVGYGQKRCIYDM